MEKSETQFKNIHYELDMKTNELENRATAIEKSIAENKHFMERCEN